MIKITRAKKERARDKKRQRLLLTVGERSWHLTEAEGRKLHKQLAKLLDLNTDSVQWYNDESSYGLKSSYGFK